MNCSSRYSPSSCRTLSKIKSGASQRALRTRTKVLRTKSMILGSFTWNLFWPQPQVVSASWQAIKAALLVLRQTRGMGAGGYYTCHLCHGSAQPEWPFRAAPGTHADSCTLALVTAGAFLGNHSVKLGSQLDTTGARGQPPAPLPLSWPPLPPHRARPARPWSQFSVLSPAGEGPWKFLNTFFPGCALQDQAKNQKAWPAGHGSVRGLLKFICYMWKPLSFWLHWRASWVQHTRAERLLRLALSRSPHAVPWFPSVQRDAEILRPARVKGSPVKGLRAMKNGWDGAVKSGKGKTSVGTSEMFSIFEGLSHGKELQRASMCVCTSDQWKKLHWELVGEAVEWVGMLALESKRQASNPTFHASVVLSVKWERKIVLIFKSRYEDQNEWIYIKCSGWSVACLVLGKCWVNMMLTNVKNGNLYDMVQRD